MCVQSHLHKRQLFFGQAAFQLQVIKIKALVLKMRLEVCQLNVGY